MKEKNKKKSESMKGNQNASIFDIEIVKEICSKVSSGKNVLDVLKSDDRYPSDTTWFRWKDESNTVWELYVKAVQNKTEYLNSEIDRLMSRCERNEITPSQANVLIQTLKWKMSKFYPKMFGDKVDVTTDGEKLQNNINLSGLTFEQLKELANDDK